MKFSAQIWNELYGVGQPVWYFPWLGNGGIALPNSRRYDTYLRSEAWTLPGGIVVVLIEGQAGGVALAHIAIRN